MEPQTKIKPSQRADRILAVIALIIIVCAWLLGRFRAEVDLAPFLKKALPEAEHFQSVSDDTYAAWKDQSETQLIGYVAVGSSHGYGGELRIAVAVSAEGRIIGKAIIEQKETVAFFRRVLRSGLLDSFQGKSYSEPFILGQDVDSVTGATYSSRALTDAGRNALREVASKTLGYSVPPEPSPRIQFGLAEAALIWLFIFGIVGRLRRFKYKKAARWISMLTGILVLGFVYNKPLTLVLINKMLLGFWPQWTLHLYWYILLAGILLVYTVDNKNPYCEWFCPFGSTQECLAVIGGAKKRLPDRVRAILRWFQRALALGAITLALIYRNPSISSYEVFGAFFRLIGTNFHFVLLGIVLIAALIIRRPWCNYLCPLRPVTDFIRLVRNWIRELVSLFPDQQQSP